MVQDNDYKEWNAYANQYWPAHYFIDAKGRVRYFHFGEGRLRRLGKVIQTLLKEAGASVGGIVSKPAPQLDAQTPETYLGYDRGAGLLSDAKLVPDTPTDYAPARTPGNGEWSLKGKWTIAPQYVVPDAAGTLQLGFQAKNVFLVIEPQERGASLDVFVDGKPRRDTADVKKGGLAPAESRMYQLVGRAPGTACPSSGGEGKAQAVRLHLRLIGSPQGGSFDEEDIYDGTGLCRGRGAWRGTREHGPCKAADGHLRRRLLLEHAVRIREGIRGHVGRLRLHGRHQQGDRTTRTTRPSGHVEAVQVTWDPTRVSYARAAGHLLAPYRPHGCRRAVR